MALRHRAWARIERSVPALEVRGEPQVKRLRPTVLDAYAPQLIRLVRQPYAIEPVRNRTHADSERPSLEVGARARPASVEPPFLRRRLIVDDQTPIAWELDA